MKPKIRKLRVANATVADIYVCYTPGAHPSWEGRGSNMRAAYIQWHRKYML